MGTNIYIQSDFIEGYDKYLHDPMGEIRWKRLSHGGPNRREIFKILKEYVDSINIATNNVVPNGIVKELYSRYLTTIFKKIVVYKDETAHRGEGKIILDIKEAMKECPDAYGSIFLQNDQEFPISHRELFIGDTIHYLTYISFTDKWRSNCGYVVITYDGFYKSNKQKSFNFNKYTESPIYALDYIYIHTMSAGSEKFYMDFNEAPGIPEEVIIREENNERIGECVPFSELISFEEIAKCIKVSLNENY